MITKHQFVLQLIRDSLFLASARSAFSAACNQPLACSLRTRMPLAQATGCCGAAGGARLQALIWPGQCTDTPNDLSRGMQADAAAAKSALAAAKEELAAVEVARKRERAALLRTGREARQLEADADVARAKAEVRLCCVSTKRFGQEAPVHTAAEVAQCSDAPRCTIPLSSASTDQCLH